MSGTTEYSKICHISELKEGTGKRFFINETEIAVFKIKERIFAVSNICPHQKTASMFEGEVENGFVICPFHGWKFNLETGNTPSGGNGLKTYDVKIENEFVFVKVVPAELNW